jgi:hypothetical protein
MKHIDISKSVMHKIALSEKKNIASWKTKYMTLFVGLTALFIVIFLFIGWTLYEQQAFDLLTLFSEDREIIVEFWQDTVISFVQELPEPETVIGGVVLCITIMSILVTRNKRKKIVRTEKDIQKYTKS